MFRKPASSVGRYQPFARMDLIIVQEVGVTTMSSISMPASPPFCIQRSLRLVASKFARVSWRDQTPSTNMSTVSPLNMRFTVRQVFAERSTFSGGKCSLVR